MKTSKRLILLAMLGSWSATTATAADAPARIREGLKAHDRAIHVKDGWIRDPYITRGPDGRYVLTGTTQAAGRALDDKSIYNKGLGEDSLVGWKVRAWSTGDFATWDDLGVVFTLKDGVWAAERPKRFREVPESKWRLWAPEVHFLDGRWALVHTSPSPVPSSNLALSSGPKLEGPWSQPMGVAIGHRHDPSLFRDDDGATWLIWGATQIAPLKPDYSGLAAEPTPIGPAGAFSRMGHEGCLIRKIGGKYVLFGTGWSTGKMRKGSYNLYYATADAITGPYSERRFVGRFLGHGTPFQDDQGRWWCTAFYNADVPPLPRAGIVGRDLSETAQTINPQGVTLVPLDVETLPGGDVRIRAKDPAYASPGPDEAQPFDR